MKKRRLLLLTILILVIAGIIATCSAFAEEDAQMTYYQNYFLTNDPTESGTYQSVHYDWYSANGTLAINGRGTAYYNLLRNAEFLNNVRTLYIGGNINGISDLIVYKQGQFTSLEKVIVESGNSNYIAINGVLFNVDSNNNPYSLQLYPCCKEGTSYSVPEGIRYIDIGAFCNCSNLNSIILPSTLNSIYDRAFMNTTNLNSIRIPENVNSISRAFYNSGVKKVTFSNNAKITEIYGTFMGCASLTDITLPDSVISIESLAFDGCTSLSHLDIPASVESISSDAFYCCTNLELGVYENTAGMEFVTQNNWQNYINLGAAPEKTYTLDEFNSLLLNKANRITNDVGKNLTNFFLMNLE